MRLALSSGEGQAAQAAPRHSWIALPGLCCQAAGGDPRQAAPVAAAWVLLYTAAHLFDSVQDGDPPDPWWEPLGQGAAINVATGLLASAGLVLRQLGSPPPVAQQLSEDFQRTVLQMAGGQHADLSRGPLSLHTAWSIAEAKSGAFFRLACGAGARLAAAPPPVVDRFGDYGFNLGLIVQIGDDLEDLEAGECAPPLAVAYWTEMAAGTVDTSPVVPAAVRPGDGPIDPAIAKGRSVHAAQLYLATKQAQFRSRALAALESAGSAQPARDQLADLVCSLVPQFDSIPRPG